MPDGDTLADRNKIKAAMANDQFTLFDDSVGLSDKESTGLTLVSRLGQRLTKAQQTFNRLVKKIEALRSELERETRRLDDALAYYGTHLHPRRRRQTELRKGFVRALAAFLDDKRVKGKKDRSMLCEIIAEQLEEILAAEGPLLEDDLRALFERVNGRSFEEAQHEEFEAARDEIAAAFDDLGINIDLSDIKPGMSDETMAAKAAEMMNRFREQAEEGRESPAQSRRKTPRQLQKEERERVAEELRKKTVATIYKQLARVLHPDLELDVQLKNQKEALMQQLTVAYRNSDMHTLLRLEMEWIQREEGNVERLTDEKLAIYNETLKEQVQDLEQELHQLPLHPRYQPIVDADGPFNIVVRTDGPAEARALDEFNAKMEAHLGNLQLSSEATLLKAVLRSSRAEARTRKWQFRDDPF